MWLGIETTGRRPGAALAQHGTLVAEHSWTAGTRDAARVAPAVHALLAGQGVAVRDLAGIAVALGPGSYTGLRGGLALVKGMALAASLTVVGVPTLDAIAAPYTVPDLIRPGPLWAVLHVGRGHLVAAAYASVHAGGRAEAGSQATEESSAGVPASIERPPPGTFALPSQVVPQVRDVDALLAAAHSGAWIVGEPDADTAVRLLAGGLRMLPAMAGVGRAGWVAWLGELAAAQPNARYPVAAPDDDAALAALLPSYLDDPI